MNLKKIHARQTLCQALDDARRALNDANETQGDKLSWNEYREAEVLYAQALQKFLSNELKEAQILAQQALGKALVVKRLLEREMNHTKQSISVALERTSKRLKDLRSTLQAEREKLPRFRISRCGYYFHQAQETLNKALGAFFSNNFARAYEHLEESKTQLDAVEALLNKSNGQVLQNNHQ